MAYTEIHPIKSTLDQALEYICNPAKTDGKLLITSFGCSHELACVEFMFTLEQCKMKKGDNLAHHLVQSFEPGETTPEQAHEIGKKLADIATGGQYEYVLSTHTDKGHIHNHIMFCAANFINHKKYNSNKRSLYGIQSANDRLCREYGLSTIIPGKEKGGGLIEYTDESGQRVTRPAKSSAKSRAEYDADKQGASWKTRLRKAIDGYISVAADFEDMLKRMEADGFIIKRAKYHSYKLPGADEKTRFTGGPTLGPEYTDERIRERIAGRQKAPRRKPALTQRPEDGRVSLLIDIENNIKARQNASYERALTIINLKEAARTLNFLTENNILEYTQIQGKIAEVAAVNRQTLDALKAVEQRIADMGLLIKNIEVYQQTKPFYSRYKQAKDKGRYRQEHEAEIILHEAALNTLKAIQADKGGRLPNPDALRAEYAKLTEEKDRLYQEYGKLKRQVKQLDTVKANVDKILNVSEREPGPGKDVARQ